METIEDLDTAPKDGEDLLVDNSGSGRGHDSGSSGESCGGGQLVGDKIGTGVREIGEMGARDDALTPVEQLSSSTFGSLQLSSEPPFACDPTLTLSDPLVSSEPPESSQTTLVPIPRQSVVSSSTAVKSKLDEKSLIGLSPNINDALLSTPSPRDQRKAKILAEWSSDSINIAPLSQCSSLISFLVNQDRFPEFPAPYLNAAADKERGAASPRSSLTPSFLLSSAKSPADLSNSLHDTFINPPLFFRLFKSCAAASLIAPSICPSPPKFLFDVSGAVESLTCELTPLQLWREVEKKERRILRRVKRRVASLIKNERNRQKTAKLSQNLARDGSKQTKVQTRSHNYLDLFVEDTRARDLVISKEEDQRSSDVLEIGASNSRNVPRERMNLDTDREGSDHGRSDGDGGNDDDVEDEDAGDYDTGDDDTGDAFNDENANEGVSIIGSVENSNESVQATKKARNKYKACEDAFFKWDNMKRFMDEAESEDPAKSEGKTLKRKADYSSALKALERHRDEAVDEEEGDVDSDDDEDDLVHDLLYGARENSDEGVMESKRNFKGAENAHFRDFFDDVSDTCDDQINGRRKGEAAKNLRPSNESDDFSMKFGEDCVNVAEDQKRFGGLSGDDTASRGSDVGSDDGGVVRYMDEDFEDADAINEDEDDGDGDDGDGDEDDGDDEDGVDDDDGISGDGSDIDEVKKNGGIDSNALTSLEEGRIEKKKRKEAKSLGALMLERESLSREIEEMEEKLVGERHWSMRGEVGARGRPLNSLLELQLDLPQLRSVSGGTSGRSGADLPSSLSSLVRGADDDDDAGASSGSSSAITGTIELILKHRIEQALFDDVQRREGSGSALASLSPEVSAASSSSSKTEDDGLDFVKSGHGLGELYAKEFEKEFMKIAMEQHEKRQQMTGDDFNNDEVTATATSLLHSSYMSGQSAKELNEKKELTLLFSKLIYKLDCLSNSSFVPRPVDVKIKSRQMKGVERDVEVSHSPDEQRGDSGIITVEDAIPLLVSGASRIAPHERLGNALKKKEEMTQEERKAVRRAGVNRRRKRIQGLVREGLMNQRQALERKQKLTLKNRENTKRKILANSVGSHADSHASPRGQLPRKRQKNSDILAQAKDYDRASLPASSVKGMDRKLS